MNWRESEKLWGCSRGLGATLPELDLQDPGSILEPCGGLLHLTDASPSPRDQLNQNQESGLHSGLIYSCPTASSE